MNSGNNNKWICNGGIYYQVPADFKTYSSPGPGVFKIQFHRERGFGLEWICEKFELPSKVYNLGIDSFLGKVKNTWTSDYFRNSQKNLGVILSGIKGAGKTLSAKILCNELDLPIIMISGPIEGLVEFIQSIDFECIIFIDEAEKMFESSEDRDDSQMLLRMIDGSVNFSRKLFILTTNTLNVNENLIGRPGRIRYIKEFTNINQEAIDEYLKDKLIDMSKADEIKELTKLLKVSTIDTLSALVDEVNIHGDLSNYEDLNLTLKSNLFSFLYVNINNLGFDNENLIKDLRKYVKSQFTLGRKLLGDTLNSWLYSKFNNATDPSFARGKPSPYIIGGERDDYDERPSDSLALSDTLVTDYLNGKFNTWNDTMMLKLNTIKVGDTLNSYGTVTNVFSDGWVEVVSDYGDTRLMYLNKEKTIQI